MARDLTLILDDMHAAILSGDFENLTRLVPLLEAAHAQIESDGHPSPATVLQKAERNALCLQAAIYGVKSARRRVADIADAARGFTTYDRVGGKATLSMSAPQTRRV